MDTASHLLAKFERRFAGSAALYRAPGRVNLMGEHTDYNDGFVLPAAIGFSCCVAVALRNDRKLALYSETFDSIVETNLDSLPPHARGNWSDYPIGVATILEKSGFPLPGANIYMISDVPVGVGLSSSAAIDVAVGYALLDSAALSHRPQQASRALPARGK